MKQKLFYYKFPGGFYAQGPVRAASERAARAEIRGDRARLPRGTEVWETTERDIQTVADSKRGWR